MKYSIFNNYGYLGVVELIFHWLYTKLFFRTCRLVRFPIHIRGRHAISIGVGFTAGRNVRLDAFPLNLNHTALLIGKDVQLNDSVHIGAVERVEIGDNTLIASRVFITDHDHGIYSQQDCSSGPDVAPIKRSLVAKPVYIGRNVWLGEQVFVLPGVTIGDGAVIGAGSIVTRDIPARCVAVGSPARVVRQWDESTQEWKRVHA